VGNLVLGLVGEHRDLLEVRMRLGSLVLVLEEGFLVLMLPRVEEALLHLKLLEN
jgi:hypothetical protein